MKRLKSILSKTLEIEESRITDSMTPGDVETWDSFNALLLVTELESVFNIKFTIDEVTSVKCVGDIRKALQNHGVTLQD